MMLEFFRSNFCFLRHFSTKFNSGCFNIIIIGCLKSVLLRFIDQSCSSSHLHKHVPLMLDYQKDLKNTSIIHHTYYHVLFCEMLFLLKIVLVIYFIILKANCVDILPICICCISLFTV